MENSQNKLQVCTVCGFYGEPKTVKKGNGLIEFVLWFCWIVPGLIYSIWRRSNQKPQCPICGSTSLIPPASHMAQLLIKENKVSNVPIATVPEKPKTFFSKFGIGLLIYGVGTIIVLTLFGYFHGL